MKIIKRSGLTEDFNKEKIFGAITKSMNETKKGVDVELAEIISNAIEVNYSNLGENPTVEDVQDNVEYLLMDSNRKDVAKQYILYRQKRSEVRENTSSFMKLYDSIVNIDNQDLMQENANVDGESPMGQMGKIGFESAKIYATRKMLSPEIRKAMEENYIHPHDLDFMPTGTTTCCQIPLGKMLKKGFNTGHGFMREPQSIMSACSLTAIILQANQNQQHGGQAIPTFDYDLAPYVEKTYDSFLSEILNIPTTYTTQEKEDWAWNKTVRATEQAMEGFVHNMNSMNSRSAGQVPFTSINYGTDTSRGGRLVIESVLKATERGLGKGETPIFPIQIFKVKDGVNLNVTDPNYDLFKLACVVTSKRLFPNFAFLDSPFNKEIYDGTPESEVAYMGCRTRVASNINGREIVTGRGNLSFTTINLVKVALASEGNVYEFFKILSHYVELSKEQLLSRYKFQCSKQVKNFKFLMTQGVWMDSEKLSMEDNLHEVLKHGTLSVGFIGLAEALKVLTGNHHGESDDSLQLGIDIVNHMRNMMNSYVEEYKLNFSLLATPAEGTAGKFVKKDRKEFGTIDGITDREYYTNSFHIPVYYQTTVFNKIKIEGEFHKFCNAGHISYVELDGNARENPEAIMNIVKAMNDNGIGYGSINHPVDRCPLCGFGGIIGNECPECHTKEQDGVTFERIRRITGYLVGTMNRWNSAKRAEERDRVKHG